MDLELSGEQKQIQQLAREFAAKEIAPHVKEWDQNAAFPRELFSRLGEVGLLGIIFPEEYGGAGLGYVEYVIAIEELSRVDGSVGLSVAAHCSLCTNHIFQSGPGINEEQRQKYLPGLISGQKVGCWGLTEPEAGSDAASLRTRAERTDTGWVINGSKAFITNGGLADVGVMMALTDPSSRSHGISAFVIEKGTPGFRAGRKEHKLGMRASDTSEMLLDDCRIPRENLLGAEGQGFVDCLKVLDGGRISIAALSLGIAQGAFEAALRYSQQRRQFGKPIAEFQGIQWKLADMATEIEAARLLTYRAALRKDQGLAVTKESSMAKLFASEAAARATEHAMQIYGGYGFLQDYPVEKYYRDVRLCTVGEGTSEIQRLVIARSLLENHG